MHSRQGPAENGKEGRGRRERYETKVRDQSSQYEIRGSSLGEGRREEKAYG